MGLSGLRRLLLVAAGLVLAGCSASLGASAPSTTTTVPGQIVYASGANAIAKVAIDRLPGNFNPLTPAGSNAVTAEVMAAVWPSPYVVGARLPPSPCPVGGEDCGSVVTAAELVRQNPMVVTYVIDPRAVWSDGVPITSDDFIEEWHEELKLGGALPATNPLEGYEDIKSIGPADAKTLTVTFSQPYADWESLFAPLVPAHIAESGGGWINAFNTFNPAKVVSGGPYVIQQVTKRNIVLVRNPSFWGPAPGLNEIIFRVEPTERATLRALSSGAVDVALLPPGPAVDSLVAADPDLYSASVSSPRLEQLDFNLADPVLSSFDVRDAIAHSIDRHQLLANTIGLVSPAASVVGNRLFLSGAPGSQGNDSAYQAVDLDETDSLLSSAGYHLDAEGVVDAADGTPLTLTLTGPSGDPLAAEIEEQVQAQLLAAGITLRVVNVPAATLLSSVLPSGDYEIALAPYDLSPFPSSTAPLYTDPVGPVLPGTSATPGSTPTPATSTHALPTPGSRGLEPASVASGAVTRDVLGFSDGAIGTLFEEASQDLNGNADSSLYNEIDTDLWAELPTLPLFQLPETLVSRVQLIGVSDALSAAGPLWDVSQWQIQVSPPLPTTTTLAPGS